LHALQACKLVKNRYPDVPIIWGGIHASLLPEQTLEKREETFPELPIRKYRHRPEKGDL